MIFKTHLKPKYMKKILVKLIQTLLIVILLCLTYAVSAQPPDPNDSNNSSGNKLNGGGAPIGSGLFILLGLGAAYGGKKLYEMKKDRIEE